MTTRRTVLLTLTLIALALATHLIVSGISSNVGLTSVLAGDPIAYQEHWAQISKGAIPYVDIPFEHFPITIVPIATADLVRHLTGFDYAAAFAVVSSVLVIVTAISINKIAARLKDKRLVWRFSLALLPLLPLALFRTDTLALMFATLALASGFANRPSRTLIFDAGGILSKGWPVVRALDDWWQGRRRRAEIVVVMCLVVIGGLLLTPGFREARSFEGVHQETLSGSLTLVWRHMSGQEPGIMEAAGALYVDVGWWAVLLNLGVGATIGLLTLSQLRSRYTWILGTRVLSAAVLAILIASPLLSAQFLLWPLTYLAIGATRRELGTFIVCGLLSTSLVWFWDPGASWFAMITLVRNLILVALATTLALASSPLRRRLVALPA